MKMPHLIGSIKVARSEKNDLRFRILDGHHRKEAILDILNENPIFDMDIELDVYYVADAEEGDIELHNLFVKANNNKNVEKNDIPNVKVIQVINSLVNIWPKNIKIDEEKGAYRPNITKRDLFKALKDKINVSTKTHKEIVEAIVQFNDKLRLMPLNDIFNKMSMTKARINSYDKAKKTHFYLNLDCCYNIGVWPNMI
jgi:hypothetical protein